MLKPALIIVSVLLIYSCNNGIKDVAVIHYDRIHSAEDSVCIIRKYYKGAPLDGTYKVKMSPIYIKKGLHFRPFNFYSLASFKNGYYHGEVKSYQKENIARYESYKNGLLHGYSITYDDDGRKSFCINYKDGLPNGKEIIYKDNGIDTLYSNVYNSTPYKMDVYLESKYISETQFYDDVRWKLDFNCCIIKTEEYVVRYYLRADSSLINKLTWTIDKACNFTYTIE